MYSKLRAVVKHICYVAKTDPAKLTLMKSYYIENLLELRIAVRKSNFNYNKCYTEYLIVDN